MPTYSYQCANCKEKVDEVKPIKHHTSTITCIECGGTMTQYHKQMPSIDTHFEGSYKMLNPTRGVYKHN